MPGERILVTGGSGFIGSALMKRLIRQDKVDLVVNLDALTYAANPLSLDGDPPEHRYQFLEGNICNPETVRLAIEMAKPTVIFHLAAETHVDRSLLQPQIFTTTNVVGTSVMLEQSHQYWTEIGKPDHFRFIHVSTDEVYGSLTDSGSFDVHSNYRPNSPYAATKAASDHLVRAWNQSFGLPTLLCHSSNIFGPRQYPEKLLPLCIERCLTQKSLPIYGKGLQVRDWLFVEDKVDALIALKNFGSPGRTYLFPGNHELSNLDFVENICRVMDKLSPADNGQGYANLINFVDDRPGHDFRYALTPPPYQDELGWQPASSFSDALKTTIRWYLKNPAWLEAATGKSFLQWCNQQYPNQ